MTKPEVDPAELAKAALAAATAEAAVAEKMRADRIAQAEADASAKAIAERAAREAAITEARLAEEARRAAEERAKIEAEMFLAKEAAEERARQEALAAAGIDPNAEIEMEEGETMDDLKAKMANMKPKKQSIPADLLDTANTYDDKVALIRMIVSDNSTRVAGVLKNMIQQ
jgi:membrane protein involved in colicin uptake